MTTVSEAAQTPTAQIPYPDADLLAIAAGLPEPQRARFLTIRNYLQTTIRPGACDFWDRGEFPFHLIEGLAEHGLPAAHLSDQDNLLNGLIRMELARADLSVSTFIGVHSELFCGAIDLFGSDRQRTLLPDLMSLRRIGGFALTEPDHGSDISRGLSTTARRHGDGWILNGQKRWIGNGTIADSLLVWARDSHDGQIKGFIVETTRPGFTASLIGRKIAARSVQNADIDLRDVFVPDENRLPGASSFRDTNELLKKSRIWVAWQATGLQFAAIDVARSYALARSQFGRPLAGFQLIQEQLARMIGNATISLALMSQIARMQDAKTDTMDQAALAKFTVSARMRETVAIGRSILGGNGISTEYEMAKIFADAEAVYSWEGSYEMNALIVARAVTGMSAFV